MSEFDFGLGSSPSSAYNRPIIGLLGQFTLAAGVNVPYISTTLEIERVVKELKAFDQIPPSLTANWSLRELCQRDIDYERIETELVNGYLKAADKLKFFNALTFIFFPKSADGGFQEKFESYEGNDPVIPHPEVELDKQFASGATKLVFGGVQVATKGAFARVRWDDNRVAAIAVDGQHRLTALRKWWESKEQTLTADEKRTKIPVLFMLLHPEAGFVTHGSLRSLRQVARDIFTDLNKNARKVDEARELILDDRSLDAECVRRLVTHETSKDAEDLLPLSLVRWQEPNNRFDQGYYLNSLLNLHQLVRVAVPVKEISDPLDPNKVRDYITELNNCLYGAAGELAVGGVGLAQHYEERYVISEDEGDIRPFVHLPPGYLSAAADQFVLMHKPYIVCALMGLKPYRELLQYCRKESLICGEFSQFLAQPASHRIQLRDKLEAAEEDWHRRAIDAHVGAIMSIKRYGRDDETWCFKAIFQKALIKLLRAIVFVNGGNSESQRRLGQAQDVMAYLDQLYDGGLMEIKKVLPGGDGPLWAGIGVRFNDSKIKVNKAVEEAIYSLLLLGYYSERKFRHDTNVGRAHTKKASELVRYFSLQTSGDDVVTQLWPGADDAHRKLIQALGKEAPSWKKMPEDKDRRKAAMETSARERLAKVLGAFSISYEFDEQDE